MVFLNAVTVDGARGRLRARGEARAIIRRDGLLPDDAPPFGDTIDTDLAEYGVSLLRAAMALREAQGEPELWRRGFVQAGNTFEALVQNGLPNDVMRGFYRIAGAAGYHLAGYSALAFSLIAQRPEDPNFSPVEEAIALLILRDLTTLSARSRSWLRNAANGDQQVVQLAQQGEIDPDDVIQIVLNSTVYRGSMKKLGVIRRPT